MKNKKREVTLRYVVSGAVTVELPTNWDKMTDNEKGIWANVKLEVLHENNLSEIVDSLKDGLDDAPQCEAIEDNDNDYNPLVPYSSLWKCYRNEED